MWVTTLAMGLGRLGGGGLLLVSMEVPWLLRVEENPLYITPEGEFHFLFF
ncbi:MAG: hypothetical protein HQL55_06195 [Magnetococcales bacterium]|nr:hypothetical protein [Magnetococcales bacterium]